ncbi:PorP/SprF family type IX secretion system membrane protein [Croceitalea rosinachiae]|uniref:PorP/SprF family type IX secretion system membrane protein n=1 Tax=Croceitalea rosinachiae TaxID=3075596 RepID=A0ABU3AD25_9FLAO|nr:PorP/SprF family type IX secretion system membrane protein [Croceitalea sp. F388]MDT0607785.1 PorP/SprF family type IX secretion system membrane protein [Croceitalea sp. F388]
MNPSKIYIPKICLLLAVALAIIPQVIEAQETSNQYNVKSPFHNQLFFNRFLINPTYSLVRENKSYLNVLMRNQYSGYDDNNQNYYLGFSNKLDENTALGLGVYGRWSGIVQEFGFNANYATAVKLGEKSALAFGTNVNYLSQGLDKNRIITNESDPIIEDSRKENKINIEPGINLTVGKFDFGVFFKDLVSYNQTTEELLTNFGSKNLNTMLQYTHKFKNAGGIFENGRFMPLVQLGTNVNDELSYTGSLLLELPKVGWVQSTYDNTYGFSSGIGFNLNKKLSLGYLMEKNLDAIGDNLGWNHELSLAYSFNDELRGLGVDVNIVSSEDERVDEIVRNYEEQIVQLRQQMKEESIVPKDENSLAFENRLVLDELILRQDSIERARDRMFERRFETMVRLLRHEMRQEQKLPKEKIRSRYAETGIAENSTENKKAKDNRKELFDDSMIKAQNRSDLIGVESGYYIIANVFKNKTYLRSFIDKLKKDGLDARQFYNKENGLHYVYLADFETKDDASIAHVNHLDGAYEKDKWIMEVYNPMATADISFE